jgi:hypothetical protein
VLVSWGEGLVVVALPALVFGVEKVTILVGWGEGHVIAAVPVVFVGDEIAGGVAANIVGPVIVVAGTQGHHRLMAPTPMLSQ